MVTRPTRVRRIKGVTANSLRNLAEIGNQPVDGRRRDPRWSVGGRGRVPRGTVPGGLYPHSEVGSGGLGCHDDHSRLLGQPYSRVETGSPVECVESSMTYRSPATSLPARRPHRRCVCADLTHPTIDLHRESDSGSLSGSIRPKSGSGHRRSPGDRTGRSVPSRRSGCVAGAECPRARASALFWYRSSSIPADRRSATIWTPPGSEIPGRSAALIRVRIGFDLLTGRDGRSRGELMHEGGALPAPGSAELASPAPLVSPRNCRSFAPSGSGIRLATEMEPAFPGPRPTLLRLRCRVRNPDGATGLCLTPL